MIEPRQDHVNFLADAWQHRHASELARRVVEHRHLDYTREERQAALALVIERTGRRLSEALDQRVMLEAEAVVAQERGRHDADPIDAQGRALLELPSDELEALAATGALDELLRKLDEEVPDDE